MQRCNRVPQDGKVPLRRTPDARIRSRYRRPFGCRCKMHRMQSLHPQTRSLFRKIQSTSKRLRTCVNKNSRRLGKTSHLNTKSRRPLPANGLNSATEYRIGRDVVPKHGMTQPAVLQTAQNRHCPVHRAESGSSPKNEVQKTGAAVKAAPACLNPRAVSGAV